MHFVVLLSRVFKKLHGRFRAADARFLFTSVTGYVIPSDFEKEYNNWDKVDPVQLFNAPTQKSETRLTLFRGIWTLTAAYDGVGGGISGSGAPVCGCGCAPETNGTTVFYQSALELAVVSLSLSLLGGVGLHVAIAFIMCSGPTARGPWSGARA